MVNLKKYYEEYTIKVNRLTSEYKLAIEEGDKDVAEARIFDLIKTLDDHCNVLQPLVPGLSKLILSSTNKEERLNFETQRTLVKNEITNSKIRIDFFLSQYSGDLNQPGNSYN